MSLCINAEKITGVYALGGWHVVKRGSFTTDAYELVEGEDWQDLERAIYLSEYDSHPKAYTGCAWTNEGGHRISMPLHRVEAFRESESE